MSVTVTPSARAHETRRRGRGCAAGERGRVRLGALHGEVERGRLPRPRRRARDPGHRGGRARAVACGSTIVCTSACGRIEAAAEHVAELVVQRRAGDAKARHPQRGRCSVHVAQVAGVAEAAGPDQLGAGDLDAVQLAVEGGFPVVEEARAGAGSAAAGRAPARRRSATGSDGPGSGRGSPPWSGGSPASSAPGRASASPASGPPAPLNYSPDPVLTLCPTRVPPPFYDLRLCGRVEKPEMRRFA